MSARLGLSVSRTEVRAALVRGIRVLWQTTAQSVDDALATAPISRLRKPRVAVTLGLAYSQLKPLQGLPATTQTALLNRVVRENAESFFLRMGSRLVTADIERRSDGAIWGAAFDGDVLDAVVTALRRRGLPRVTVIPFAAAVAALPNRPRVVWDDQLGIEISTIEGGQLQSVRRLVGQGEDSNVSIPLGAALSLDRTSFAWRPGRSAARNRTFDRLRVGAAAALLVASVSAAVAAPGVRAQRIAESASRQLAVAQAAQARAARIDADLRRVTAQLEYIDLFRSNRGRMTTLLGALSQALPESTAIVSLRVDSLEGSFVALAPHAADILPELAGLELVQSPRIMGSVTREVQGAARVERATVRFRRPKAAR